MTAPHVPALGAVEGDASGKGARGYELTWFVGGPSELSDTVLVRETLGFRVDSDRRRRGATAHVCIR